MQLYKHQLETAEFLHHTGGRALIASDPGTGKTGAVLAWFAELLEKDPDARLVVLAPRAICRPAWLADAKKFAPHLKVTVATGSRKEKLEAANFKHHILVTNHDAITQDWFLERAKNYTACVVDESTAFKGNTSARTKALLQNAKHWRYRVCMTGTPMPNSVLDLWSQLAFIDSTLTGVFSAWRAQVCQPKTVMIGNGRSVFQWEERPGIRDALMTRYANHIIRYAKGDCTDLPPQVITTMPVPTSSKMRAKLDEFRDTLAVELEQGMLTAAHAGARAIKLLQLTSGFVYMDNAEHERISHLVDSSRYELVTQLVSERAHTLVAIRFRAQAEYLSEAFGHAGISHAILDGNTSTKDMTTIVEDYQAGKYQTLICQPQAVSHGLTLTRATAVIWTSPTFNAEHFIQFNARIDRIGQTQHNEVICIASAGTYEEQAYARLMGKVHSQQGALDTLRDFTRG